ncbi:MAG: MFS transporter, partial [Microbacterium sp.]
HHPLIDFRLVAGALVSSGLAFKAASSLAVAGMGYLITLQLQLAWGWTAGQAALGMLPQVVVLIAGGWIIGPLMKEWGLRVAAWLSSIAVVIGLGVYALLGTFGYAWIALALVLVAAGMRVVGVVAGNNIMRGVPENRTTMGAALADTAGEVATGIGIALSGTILATMFTGTLTDGNWTDTQAEQFNTAVTWAGIILTVLAALLVAWGIARSRQREVNDHSENERRSRPASA